MFKTTMILRVLITVLLLSHRSLGNQVETGCRGLQCESIQPPPPREVNPEDTYAERTNTAIFCQPDDEGYFGSTFGESLLIKYSFGLEALAGANMKDIFKSFSDAIEDLLIGSFFGNVCTKHGGRRKLEGRGFRFNPVLHDTEYETCQPEVESAHCGIYEGTVDVFGNSEGVLDYILKYLDKQNGNAKIIHPQILRIFPGRVKEEMLDDNGEPEQKQISDFTFTLPPSSSPTLSTKNPSSAPTFQPSIAPTSGPQEDGEEEKEETMPPTAKNTTLGATNEGKAEKKSFPKAAIVGIVLSIFSLVIGIVGFLYFDRKRRAERRLAPYEEGMIADRFLNEPSGFVDIDLEDEARHHRSLDDDEKSISLIV